MFKSSKEVIWFILGFIFAMFEPLKSYFLGQPFEPITFTLTLLPAIFSWYQSVKDIVALWLVNQKDWVTDLIAVLIFLYEPVMSYLSNEQFNWRTFVMTIFGAVIAWFTGKYRTMFKEGKKVSDQKDPN